MSRSYKKTPMAGVTKAESTKGYKKQRVGQERARQRELIRKAKIGLEVAIAFLSGELAQWNEWACERDGKRYFDPAEHPKLMRK